MLRHKILSHAQQFNDSDDTELNSLAERLLIRELQKRYYGKEYRMALKAKIDFLDKGLIPPETLRSSSNLDLFMDHRFLLRCKGRLQNVSFPWDTIFDHTVYGPAKRNISHVKI